MPHIVGRMQHTSFHRLLLLLVLLVLVLLMVLRSLLFAPRTGRQRVPLPLSVSAAPIPDPVLARGVLAVVVPCALAISAPTFGVLQRRVLFVNLPRHNPADRALEAGKARHHGVASRARLRRRRRRR